MNVFLHGSDVCCIFLSTGLSRKNIYIKEYAFFDRAHSTKYMSQKDEIWERLLLLFELSLFSAYYLLLSVAAPYGVSLHHGVIRYVILVFSR